MSDSIDHRVATMRGHYEALEALWRAAAPGETKDRLYGRYKTAEKLYGELKAEAQAQHRGGTG